MFSIIWIISLITKILRQKLGISWSPDSITLSFPSINIITISLNFNVKITKLSEENNIWKWIKLLLSKLWHII